MNANLFAKIAENDAVLATTPCISSILPLDEALDLGNGLRRELVYLAFADRFFDMFNGVQPVLIFRRLLSADMNYLHLAASFLETTTATMPLIRTVARLPIVFKSAFPVMFP